MNRRQGVFLACCLIIFGSVAVYTVMTSIAYGESNSKLKVVATFYPLSYLAEMIAGDKAKVVSLIQPGVEVHSWQPSTYNLVDASNGDIILYNGAGLDRWVEDDLLPVINLENKVVVDTSKHVELIVFKEQAEIEEHGIYDPHTWMSPDTALQQAKSIFESMVKADPGNADFYSQRWLTLSSRLIELDGQYNSTLMNRTGNIIFTTHDAFGYLARRYGFEQHGVLGLSADQQPSTQTIAEIVNLMEASNTYVFYLEPGYSDIYMQTIRSELATRTVKNIKILKLYHMDGLKDGLDYLGQMEANLLSLAEGLK